MFDFLFHFLQQHSTADGYTVMAPFVKLMLILLGLSALFVSMAKIHESARAEGKAEGADEGFEEGHEQGFEQGFEEGIEQSAMQRELEKLASEQHIN